MISAGSISGFGLDVKRFYTISEPNGSKEYSASKLTLVDIQFLGQQPQEKFLEMIKEPRSNNLYISGDSHLDIILSNEKSNSKDFNRRRTNLFDKFTDSILSDELYTYNEFDDSSIFAGAITKMRRLPIISIYKNKKSIEFNHTKVLSHREPNKHIIDSSNEMNYIIHLDEMSDDSAKIYLVANPSETLSYHTSYLIHPKDWTLSEINIMKESKELTKYFDTYRNSELSINNKNWESLISMVIKSK